VDEFRAMGFLPQGLLNGLALLGWGDNMPKPVFDLNELTERFNINNVNKKGAIFDIDKLKWINGQHLSRRDAAEIWPYVKALWLKASWIGTDFPDEKGIAYTALLKSRMRMLNDFLDYAGYLFRDPESYDEAAVDNYLKAADMPEHISALFSAFRNCLSFTRETAEIALRNCTESRGLSAAALIHPLRLALTGFSVSPDLFTIAELLGKETVLRRLGNLLSKLLNA
ncbi:MAG: glutamate--tRNA ligase family protein, partial [Candidatus Marinimicrobia bacterium]|nr:glutamate--tRNA ligase family protein [Candidatus Neomarinimicrobiota bacterium]